MQGGKAVMMPVAAAVGLTASEDAEAGPISRGGKRILEAWHGSPHRFPPVRELLMPDGQRLIQNLDESIDIPEGAKVIAEHPMGKFDMSKIGTGEGAQAYGHGLYFADAEDVARGYRDSLAQRPGGIQNRGVLDGVEYPDLSDAERKAMDVYALNDFDIDAAITSAENISPDSPLSGILREIKSGKRAIEINQGALYRTEIDIDPDTLLDWDKPLSEQPGIMAALDRVQTPTGTVASDAQRYFARPGLGRKNPTGSHLMDFLREAGGGDAANASATARQAGIPGIRYLDGMSRNAGEGSYNYVMFDDAPIRIVERGAATPEAMALAAIPAAGALYAQKRLQTQDTYRQARQGLSTNLHPLPEQYRAGYHGEIAPPNHPAAARIAEALDGINRSLGGSWMSLLDFRATAPWLNKLSYGHDPSAMETLEASMEWMP